MLTSVVLQLQALENGRFQGSTGRAVHGFWFQQWQRTCPAVAKILHEANTMLPFTLSPLMGLSRPRKGKVTVTAGTEAWLRITTLHQSLSQPFLETWLPRLPALADLAGIPWRIQAIALTPQQHPWAGRQTSDKLQQVREAAPSPKTWRFTLATPTTFHSGDKIQLPFPLPDSIVNSWLRRWQTFAPHPIEPDIRPQLRQGLMVSAYDLKTVPVRNGRRLLIGCVGKITLRAAGLTPQEKRIVNMLAHYAYYCGSGQKTTQGMGMTRLD